MWIPSIELQRVTSWSVYLLSSSLYLHGLVGFSCLCPFCMHREPPFFIPNSKKNITFSFSFSFSISDRETRWFGHSFYLSFLPFLTHTFSCFYGPLSFSLCWTNTQQTNNHSHGDNDDGTCILIATFHCCLFWLPSPFTFLCSLLPLKTAITDANSSLPQ